MNWPLLQNSLLVATLTMLLSVGVGFVAALWLAGLERRWRNRVRVAAIALEGISASEVKAPTSKSNWQILPHDLDAATTNLTQIFLR